MSATTYEFSIANRENEIGLFRVEIDTQMRAMLYKFAGYEDDASIIQHFLNIATVPQGLEIRHCREITLSDGAAKKQSDISRHIDDKRIASEKERHKSEELGREMDRIVESIKDFTPYIEQFRADHPLANNHPRGSLKPIDPMTSGFFRAWLHDQWKRGLIELEVRA